MCLQTHSEEQKSFVGLAEEEGERESGGILSESDGHDECAVKYFFLV